MIEAWDVATKVGVASAVSIVVNFIVIGVFK